MASETELKPESKQIETWKGSCHCGKVKFTLRMPGSLYDEETLSCNCTICLRNGYLFIYRLNMEVTWESGRDELKSYLFAGKRIEHRFCPECGSSVCANSVKEGFYDQYTALNVRVLEDVDIDKLKLKKVDGRSASGYD